MFKRYTLTEGTDPPWDKSSPETVGYRTLENPALRLKGGSGKGSFRVSTELDSETNNGLASSCSADKAQQLGKQSNRNQLAAEETMPDAMDEFEAESSSFTSDDENEMRRLRGGCGGGCGSVAQNSACCPCGGCGGAACGTTCKTCCETRPPPSGCCGGNQSRGLPCRWKWDPLKFDPWLKFSLHLWV